MGGAGLRVGRVLGLALLALLAAQCARAQECSDDFEVRKGDEVLLRVSADGDVQACGGGGGGELVSLCAAAAAATAARAVRQPLSFQYNVNSPGPGEQWFELGRVTMSTAVPAVFMASSRVSMSDGNFSDVKRFRITHVDHRAVEAAGEPGSTTGQPYEAFDADAGEHTFTLEAHYGGRTASCNPVSNCDVTLSGFFFIQLTPMYSQ